MTGESLQGREGGNRGEMDVRYQPYRKKKLCHNLYLRGADLYSISRMMGHSSVTMTEGYVVCGLREQSKEVFGVFLSNITKIIS